MWGLISAPLDSWDDMAFWQLAMCEFALDHLDDDHECRVVIHCGARRPCRILRALLAEKARTRRLARLLHHLSPTLLPMWRSAQLR